MSEVMTKKLRAVMEALDQSDLPTEHYYSVQEGIDELARLQAMIPEGPPCPVCGGSGNLLPVARCDACEGSGVGKCE